MEGRGPCRPRLRYTTTQFWQRPSARAHEHNGASTKAKGGEPAPAGDTQRRGQEGSAGIHAVKSALRAGCPGYWGSVSGGAARCEGQLPPPGCAKPRQRQRQRAAGCERQLAEGHPAHTARSKGSGVPNKAGGQQRGEWVEGDAVTRATRQPKAGRASGVTSSSRHRSAVSRCAATGLDQPSLSRESRAGSQAVRRAKLQRAARRLEGLSPRPPSATHARGPEPRAKSRRKPTSGARGALTAPIRSARCSAWVPSARGPRGASRGPGGRPGAAGAQGTKLGIDEQPAAAELLS